MEGGRQSGREGERWETEGGRETDRHKTDPGRVRQAQPCSRPRGTGPHQAPPFALIPRTRHGKREREGGGDIPHLNDMPDKINDSDLTSFQNALRRGEVGMCTVDGTAQALLRLQILRTLCLSGTRPT